MRPHGSLEKKSQTNMTIEHILDIKVNFDLTLKEILDKMTVYIASGECHLICTTNPEFIVDAQDDPEFRRIINASALSLPDGVGILFARAFLERLHKIEKGPLYIFKAFFLGIYIGIAVLTGKLAIGKTIPGSTLVDKLCRFANEKQYSVFFLGGWPKDKYGKPLLGNFDLAKDAAEIMKNKYPNLKVAGSSSEYSYKEKDDVKNLSHIHKCMKEHGLDHIDIIFVAYGHIKQEKWLKRNAGVIPARIGIGVGGTLDYITGAQLQPNEYIRSKNLEWLHRLVTQPWRIRRIFKAFPLFPLLVFFRAIKIK